MARWLIGLMVNRHNSERLRGFCDRQTDRQTDICDSRVAFATEKVSQTLEIYLGKKYTLL